MNKKKLRMLEADANERREQEQYGEKSLRDYTPADEGMGPKGSNW